MERRSRKRSKRGDVGINTILLVIVAVIVVALLIYLVYKAASHVSTSITGIGGITVTAYGSGETGTVTITVTNNYDKPITVTSIVVRGAGSCNINRQIPPGQTISFTCTVNGLAPGQEYTVIVYYTVGSVQGSASTSFTAS